MDYSQQTPGSGSYETNISKSADPVTTQAPPPSNSPPHSGGEVLSPSNPPPHSGGEVPSPTNPPHTQAPAATSPPPSNPPPHSGDTAPVDPKMFEEYLETVLQSKVDSAIASALAKVGTAATAPAVTTPTTELQEKLEAAEKELQTKDHDIQILKGEIAELKSAAAKQKHLADAKEQVLSAKNRDLEGQLVGKVADILEHQTEGERYRAEITKLQSHIATMRESYRRTIDESTQKLRDWNDPQPLPDITVQHGLAPPLPPPGTTNQNPIPTLPPPGTTQPKTPLNLPLPILPLPPPVMPVPPFNPSLTTVTSTQSHTFGASMMSNPSAYSQGSKRGVSDISFGVYKRHRQEETSFETALDEELEDMMALGEKVEGKKGKESGRAKKPKQSQKPAPARSGRTRAKQVSDIQVIHGDSDEDDED